MALSIGDRLPDFTLPTDGGGTLDNRDLQGRPVVLYFYPKDDTSGCTKEAVSFRDQFEQFDQSGVRVVGISRDSVASHDRFKAKHGLNFTLASDEDGRICEAFGVWVEKSMYGKKYMGIERATFLADGDGLIREVWRQVRVPGHVATVLEAVEGLRRESLR
ncbi:MAG: thioredoxin-dependent thiol peroxidase [Rhodospirillales bacterium]|nr:MAG: thioredoxin-dependent thiol peroxidase [Rhodospirillales bacterium]